VESGKKTIAKSFKDTFLKNGIYFLDLMNAMKPGVVESSMVLTGDKYASSLSCF
jgi:plastin-1